MKLTQLTEQKERPYICVHAKKGKHETHAVSSYDAAKNAAKHWGMKSTAGIDAHLAEGNYPEPRKMEVTQADKDNNTEAWKRFKAGDPRYEWKDMILSKAESYDDYHGDMSKEEYDKTVKGSQMEYTVWVGGTEVNDHWLSYEEAKRLHDKYKAQGYDDVQLDARLKEGSFWGRDDMVAKMKKDYKASGMRKYRKDTGTASYGTTTSDPEKWKELEADGYEWDKDYYNDIEELEAKWKAKNEGANKEDEEAIAARDEFLKVMDMKPKSNNKAIDTIKKIVADKQNQQVKFDDGKMKVDLYTASAVSQVYDAVKPETQEKIDNMLRTKEGMLKLSNFAFSKLSEGIKEGKRIDEILPALGQAAKAVGGALASKGVKGQVARGAAKGAVNGMIKDKSGKQHNVNSPQGKMIANMGKKIGGGTGATPSQVAQAKRDLTKNKIKAVGTKVKDFAKGALAKSADKSGFGNPLAASKQHANDMVEKAMKDAEKQAK